MMPKEMKAGDSKTGSDWLVEAQARDTAFSALDYYTVPSAQARQLARDRKCCVKSKRYRDTRNLEGEDPWHFACP